MKMLLTTLFSVLFFLQVNAQGWDKTLTDSMNVRAINTTSDGGCIILGIRMATLNAVVIKVDALGKRQWFKDFSDIPMISTSLPFDKVRIQQDSDGNYWLGVTIIFDASEIRIAKLDKNGNQLLLRKLPFKNAEINVLNNQLVVFGVSTINNLATLLRLNSNGDTISANTVPSINLKGASWYISTIKNNGILLFNTNDSLYRTQVLRIGFDGTLSSRKVIPNDWVSTPYFQSNQIIKASDGSYFIPDSATTMIKIDSSGQFIWRKPIIFTNTPPSFFFNYQIGATKDGGFIAIKNNGANRKFEIKKFSVDGLETTSSFVFYNTTLYNPYIIKSPNGGFFIAGNVNANTNSYNGQVRILKIDENGFFYPNFIKGNVFSDRDNNCQQTSGDIPTQRVFITAKKAGFSDIYALSDSLGKYNLNLDTGSYTVSVIKPNKYMTPCTPSVSKTISSGNPIDSVDFALKSDFFCGLMQVDISTPRLRRCFNNTYTVNYCNSGTATAVGAYVNITIDSLLEFVGATKTVATRTGRTYRFNLGDVAMNNCGTFDITTRVRCGDSTRLGQTLCMEAKIYPDTICVPDNTLWTGANLIVSGTCQGDSVVFQVRNGGRAASSSASSMIVENLNSTTFNVASLPVNGVFTRKYPSNGNTWRMIVN